MSIASYFLQSIFHPTEITALVQFKYFKPKHILEFNPENKQKIRCYEFLDKTSRSFAAVIKELDDDVRDAVCIFYLVLRGLDTIEDDMSIPIEKKETLLRSFHKIISQKGWTFTENGPDEKDRQLLVEFDVIIDEFLSLKKEFRDVIADITNKMGNGMADYAKEAIHNDSYGIITNKDFDKYCYYVAGLVGIGLNRLFAESGLESPELANDTDLSVHMGLFLQKTNIIRDYLEDLLDGRKFWPKEIWSNYVEDLSDLKESGYETKALDCLTSIILNTLHHAPECLNYMSKLKNKSVFSFCAIPQVMAIATLALMFRNYDTYQKVVKIRRGESIKLMLRCTSIYEVANIFREYTRVIIRKNDPRDPNFMKISVACGKIEQWCAVNLQATDVYNLPYPSIVKRDSLNQESDLLLFVGFGLLAFTAYLLYYYNWEHFHHNGLEVFDIFDA
ncbi:10627_t:CDS:2 [Scutellospora calospora]|uniref:10627_t:CDS:1 n=1 Tax=Scutellospora calospora TaxID=85575 RepID=A0ACA9L1N8_9GLOM|nr:10627_t:CDS:2 [Scutellospora calospora]